MKRTRLKAKSQDPRKVAERELYRELVIEYLAEHPVCEVEGCPKASSENHHKAGRGKMLNVVEYFMATCWRCHNKIHHGDVAWAREMGYLIYRNELPEEYQ